MPFVLETERRASLHSATLMRTFGPQNKTDRFMPSSDRAAVVLADQSALISGFETRERRRRALICIFRFIGLSQRTTRNSSCARRRRLSLAILIGRPFYRALAGSNPPGTGPILGLFWCFQFAALASRSGTPVAQISGALRERTAPARAWLSILDSARREGETSRVVLFGPFLHAQVKSGQPVATPGEAAIGRAEELMSESWRCSPLPAGVSCWLVHRDVRLFSFPP